MEHRADIDEILQEIAKLYDLGEFTVSDFKTNAKGEGFLGETCMVTIKNAHKSLDLVLKLAFKTKNVRDMVPIRMSYENEVFFYSTVVPTYKKLLERDFGGLNYNFAPECLYHSLNDNNEALVLRNLRPEGFEIFYKKRILDHDHVKLIFDNYGKFHALSYALQKIDPEEHQRLCDGTQDVLKTMEPLLEKSFAMYSESIKKTLKKGQDDEILAKFSKYEPENIIRTFREALAGSKYPVLAHGDCWSNNMMFKYDASGKPTSMRLLDFQLIKPGSPACDLSYCLYSGASKAVFDNLELYLKIYHDSLSAVLKQINLNPDEILPFEGLKEEWRQHSRFGFIMAMAIVRMKCTDNENIKDLQEIADIGTENIDTEDIKYDEEGFNKRMREIMTHMSEIDAL